MFYDPKQMSKHLPQWSKPEEAVVHIYQSGYWGNWGFQIDKKGIDAKAAQIHFARGGERASAFHSMYVSHVSYSL